MLVNIIYAMYAKFQSFLYPLFASNLEHLSEQICSVHLFEDLSSTGAAPYSLL